MAGSSVRPSFLLSLVLLFLLSFPLSSLSMKTAKVDDISSKHRNPTFCAATLNAIVGGATEVDLASVAQSVLRLAHTTAFNTITLIHSLIGSTTDAQLIQHYVTCSEQYNNVLFDLGEVKKALTDGNYNGVNTGAEAVKKYAEVCGSTPPTDPSPLPKDNENLEDLSIIVIILSNFLAQN